MLPLDLSFLDDELATDSSSGPADVCLANI